VLRALCDPGNPVSTVAALVGLFCGIDYEQLAQHSEKWSAVRAPFSFTGDWPAETAAERALARLHRYWTATRREAADIVVPQIVEELGILPFAAAGELGGSRAGAVLFALDAMRAAALAGDASLTGALAALDAALDDDESEAPLEPGRQDVVRVMNLHKAKGLEAPVVILATPFGDWSPEPGARVVRDETGRALGFATVTERKGQNQTVTLAQPYDWPAHAEEERRFDLAEDQRLLYVAATRAAQELVIGCAYNSNSPSRWRSFHDWLRRRAQRLDLPEPSAPLREVLEAGADEMLRRVATAQRTRAEHALPTYRAAPVTERKAELAAFAAGAWAADSAVPAGAVAGRGTDWGSAVHDALQYAAEGGSADELRATCRSRLIALERPLRPDGEPQELDELLDIIAAVRRSELWQRSERARQRLLEVPFAVRFTAHEYAAMAGRAVMDEIVEGRIDLAFLEDGGWTLVDYKTDAAGENIPAELLRQYRAQLALYAAAWERITRSRVEQRILLFTATGASHGC
jgi:ATP-dependent helicase/nuclease subunit A